MSVKTRKPIIKKKKFTPSNPLPFEIQEADSFDSKAIEKDTNVGQVEENVNKNKSTTPDVASVLVEPPKIKSKTPKGTKPKPKNQAPWKDEGQFKPVLSSIDSGTTDSG